MCFQGHIEKSPLANFTSNHDHDCAYSSRTAQGFASSSLPSQPIACPLSSSKDYENMMVYEEEKIYYNTMTWTMYSRIMKSRQKKQRQLLVTQKGTNRKVTPRSRDTSIDLESSTDVEEEHNSMEEEMFHIEI